MVLLLNCDLDLWLFGHKHDDSDI